MSGVWYVNAAIYGEEETLAQGSIYVRDGIIRHVANGSPEEVGPGERIVDLQGNLLLPGFVDIHIHGGGGADVMAGSAEQLARLSRFAAGHGTTSLLPTTYTASPTVTRSAVKAISEAMDASPDGADLIGIHMEGPYLNPVRGGAQHPAHMRPGTVKELQEWIDASRGRIRLVTLAPELPNAMELISFCRRQGVHVSLGHSNADFPTIVRAVEAGATQITHVFNGMSPLHHRRVGMAGAGLSLDALSVEVICDGIHIAPTLLPVIARAKPADKLILITDAIPAAGLPDGEYRVGSYPVVLRNGECRLKHNGELSGSCLTMLQAVKHALTFTGMSLRQLLPAFTLNPARQAGAAERKGSIRIGKDADFVVLTPELELLATFVRGLRVWGKGGTPFYKS